LTCSLTFCSRFFKCENRWTEDEIMEVVGIVQVNGHEVPITTPSYVAIYHLASYLQHSCCPNISKSFADNGHLVLWAPNRIKKGEQLSICYTDALWGTMSRQGHLKETKFFECTCKRCLDVTELGTNFSSLKCFDKQCNGMQIQKTMGQLDSDWVCAKCGIEADAPQIMEILNRSGRDMQAMDKQSESDCRKYLEHYSKWLPASHYFIVQVKLWLMDLLGAGGPEELQALPIESLTFKIALCRELLDVCKVIAPCETRLLGTTEFELHSGLAELGRRENVAKHECFTDILTESLAHAEEAYRLLNIEPVTTCEGKVAAQARINADSIRVMLGL
jgi:SET domain